MERLSSGWEWASDRLWAPIESGWQRFWFRPADVRPLAAMRWFAGAMILYTHLVWSLDLEAFLGTVGWNNAGVVQALHADSYGWSFWWLIPDRWLWPMHVACLVALFLFWIGCATRVTSVLAWVITISYAQRTTLSNFGLDQVNAFLAFYLMLGPSGACYSVDAWWRNRKRMRQVHGDASADTTMHRGPPRSIMARVSLRLIQCHLCVVYFWAGLSKLQGESWWTGEAIWGALANAEYQSLDMTWMARFPWLMQAMAHATVLWELFFTAMIWKHRWRPYWLAVGVMMHLGIGAFLGMWTFGLSMIIAYGAFIPGYWYCRRYWHRQRIGSFNPITLAAPIASTPSALAGSAAPIPAAPIPAAPIPAAPIPAAPIPASPLPASLGFSASTGLHPLVIVVTRSAEGSASAVGFFRSKGYACLTFTGLAELLGWLARSEASTVVLRTSRYSPDELAYWIDRLEEHSGGTMRYVCMDRVEDDRPFDRIRDRSSRLRFVGNRPEFDRILEAIESMQPPPTVPFASRGTKGHRLAMWWAVSMLALSLGCTPRAPIPDDRGLTQAIELNQLGRFAEANEQISQQLALREGTADEFYHRGVAREGMGDVQLALADYEACLKLDPRHGQALNNAGVLKAQQGALEEAIDSLHRATEVNAKDSLAWSNLGLAYQQLRQSPRALECFQAAIAIEPQASYFVHRGQTEMDLGQWDAAIASFDLAIEKEPSRADARLQRGRALSRVAQWEEAESDLLAARKADGDHQWTTMIDDALAVVEEARWADRALSRIEPILQSDRWQLVPQSLDRQSLVFKLQSLDDAAIVRDAIVFRTDRKAIVPSDVVKRWVEAEAPIARFVVDIQRMDDPSTTEVTDWLKDKSLDWRPSNQDVRPYQHEVQWNGE
jgi:tetratricopeptide (TPR) repeat protein